MSQECNQDLEPGVYILIDDGTDEFQFVLEFSARVAKWDKARIGIVHILDHNDFTHWGGINDMMEKEVRQKAEKRLWSVACKVNEISGTIPSLFLEKGSPREVIPRIVEENSLIKRLVLGAQTAGAGPGPLVSYFTGKGAATLGVPITVVPDNIDIDDLIRRR